MANRTGQRVSPDQLYLVPGLLVVYRLVHYLPQRVAIKEGLGELVQHASLAAAALYSVFSVALLVAAPEIAFFFWIWILWFAVMITAVITYEAGRYLSRSRMRVERPVTAEPSLRMGRWTVG